MINLGKTHQVTRVTKAIGWPPDNLVSPNIFVEVYSA